jgi:glycosyltransferase involved in cell wall biosynthesis
LNAAYVTIYDATDIRQWSGSGYFVAQCLAEVPIHVEYIGPLLNRRSFAAKAAQWCCQHLHHKTHLRGREPWQVKNYAKQVESRLRGMNADIVFSPGTIPIALLGCKQPIIFWADATFASLLDFYPGYDNLCSHALRDGHAMEKAALEHCALALYSSEWAARSAINFYGTSPSKVRVVPFGANIADSPDERDVARMIQARPKGKCRLLFIGNEWKRKGGDLVLETASRLCRHGVPVELTMIGRGAPQGIHWPEWAHALGYLDKSTQEGAAVIRRELGESHFLLLPSRAECFGVVLAEANAYGVPCVTSDVGGIPTAIKNDTNGHIFSVGSFADEAAAYIESIFSDWARYSELATSARREYDNRLNWRTSSGKIGALLRSI